MHSIFSVMEKSVSVCVTIGAFGFQTLTLIRFENRFEETHEIHFNQSRHTCMLITVNVVIQIWPHVAQIKRLEIAEFRYSYGFIGKIDVDLYVKLDKKNNTEMKIKHDMFIYFYFALNVFTDHTL